MTVQTRYSARYLYPGALFPEEVTKHIDEPTLEAAIKAQPDEAGYFRRDGWYAVEILATTSKRFTSPEDGEEVWIPAGPSKRVERVAVGRLVHADSIEDTEQNRILISNIRGNSDDGYGVLTRAGNWQIASDYDRVVPATLVTA